MYTVSSDSEPQDSPRTLPQREDSLPHRHPSSALCILRGLPHQHFGLSVYTIQLLGAFGKAVNIDLEEALPRDPWPPLAGYGNHNGLQNSVLRGQNEGISTPGGPLTPRLVLEEVHSSLHGLGAGRQDAMPYENHSSKALGSDRHLLSHLENDLFGGRLGRSPAAESVRRHAFWLPIL